MGDLIRIVRAPDVAVLVAIEEKHRKEIEILEKRLISLQEDIDYLTGYVERLAKDDKEN